MPEVYGSVLSTVGAVVAIIAAFVGALVAVATLILSISRERADRRWRVAQAAEHEAELKRQVDETGAAPRTRDGTTVVPHIEAFSVQQMKDEIAAAGPPQPVAVPPRVSPTVAGGGRQALRQAPRRRLLPLVFLACAVVLVAGVLLWWLA